VKALAKKTATTAQPVKSKARPTSVATTAADKPVKTLSKPATAAKPMAQDPAVQPSTPSAKVASKSAGLAKAAGAAKPTVQVPSHVAAKTSSETLARSVLQTAPKPVTKPATQTSAKAPAASKPEAVAAAKSVKPTKPTAVAPATKPAASVTKSAQSKAQAAQAAVEPTPRPLGKRAAKKVMMEQMTQADVVPTHAPDAAKATFSTTNERVVMTPPVPSAIRKDPKRANNWKTLAVDQLTDEDIMAMPDDEYMSELQLAYFRRKLIQLRADMLANAGVTTEHLREDTVVVPDPADRATIEEEHALELRTRDRERKLLKKIEQAIGRIDNGEYGYCDETGEAIGVGRLMARPTASLSLEAQQRRELKQKMFGD
jgi:DnaK suppressor protein